MRYPIITNLFLSVIFTLLSTNTYSDDSPPNKEVKNDKRYKIEIIIYQENEPQQNEVFPKYPALTDDSKAIKLIESSEGEEVKNYMSLPRTQLTLNREENLISKKKRYNVLLHTGWMQNQSDEKLVHLESNSQESTINGFIKVRRAYYYNTDITIEFTPSDSKTQYYVLNTNRKLKNNEMHYIDHPRFAILLKINTM